MSEEVLLCIEKTKNFISTLNGKLNNQEDITKWFKVSNFFHEVKKALKLK